MREPYEKPTVIRIDLGNLIQEADGQVAAASVRCDALRSRLESLLHELGDCEAILAIAQGDLELAQKTLAKVTTIQEMAEAKE